MDAEDVDAKFQVVAEAALRDLLVELSVGRGDESNVRLSHAGLAEAFVGLLLNQAEELDLRLKRDVADLVEEERAALGEGHATRSVPGVRVGPLYRSEELALQEVLGDRRAVHRDEGRVLATAPLVDGARDELLAGPALAGHEHRLLRLRRALQAPQAPDDRFRLADDATHAGRDRRRSLGLRRELGRQGDRLDEAIALVGLVQKVGGAEAHRLHRQLGGPEGGEHHHRQRRVTRLELPQELHPIHPVHPDVRQNTIEATRLDLVQRSLRARHQLRIVAGLIELSDDRRAHRRVVLHHEHRNPFSHCPPPGPSDAALPRCSRARRAATTYPPEATMTPSSRALRRCRS